MQIGCTQCLPLYRYLLDTGVCLLHEGVVHQSIQLRRGVGQSSVPIPAAWENLMEAHLAEGNEGVASSSDKSTSMLQSRTRLHPLAAPKSWTMSIDRLGPTACSQLPKKHQAQEVRDEGVKALRNKQSIVEAEWSVAALVATRVAGCTIRSLVELRFLGTMPGQRTRTSPPLENRTGPCEMS